MKLLRLAAGLVAPAVLLAVAPAAQATIVVCNNMPVMVSCYDTAGRRWCDVWVNSPRVCLEAKKVVEVS